MFGILMSKKGRAGLALPFEAITKITTTGMAIIISVLALLIWPIYAFWHQISWISMGIAIILLIIRIIRKARA